MTLNLFDIKPKSKQSDKYSIQLYNFMKKNYPRGASVYYEVTRYDSEEVINGVSKPIYKEVPFNEEDFSIMHIWIGKQYQDAPEWYHGNSLNTIIGSGACKYTNFANPWFANKTIENITDYFWNKYILLGRCFWDKEHTGWMTGTDVRFTYLNDHTRKCNWCGRIQNKTETPVTTIVTTWNNI